MLVKATEPGFYNRYIETGEVFDVPKGTKWPWVVPVKSEADAGDSVTDTSTDTTATA